MERNFIPSLDRSLGGIGKNPGPSTPPRSAAPLGMTKFVLDQFWEWFGLYLTLQPIWLRHSNF